jgi:CHAD domain-containing protein
MAKSKITVRWAAKKNAAQNAARILPGMVEEIFRDGRKVARSNAPKKPLHQFRLAVKRFRYTVELFRPCYGPALKRRLEALKAMQDYLGDVSDSEATLAMLQTAALKDLEGAGALRDFAVDRLQVKRNAFATHWRETFDRRGKRFAA